jgi:hypothetical protein
VIPTGDGDERRGAPIHRAVLDRAGLRRGLTDNLPEHRLGTAAVTHGPRRSTSGVRSRLTVDELIHRDLVPPGVDRCHGSGDRLARRRVPRRGRALRGGSRSIPLSRTG